MEDISIRCSDSDLNYDEGEVQWTESHISAVRQYVSKFEAINFTAEQDWCAIIESHNHRRITKMIVSFTQDFGNLFHQLPEKHSSKNELVAAFINFLLHLLYHRTPSMDSFEGRVRILEKELRFLVTILGDTPFICDAHELDHVPNIMAELEAVANDAGSLVHSFVFVSPRTLLFESMTARVDDLSKGIDILKADIISMLSFVSNNDAVAPKRSSTATLSHVDSLFIVDSLRYDVLDLMNRDDGGRTTVDVKDQIRMLHEELFLSQSMIRSLQNLPPHPEVKELTEGVRVIIDAAYEAEYLNNSFLVGDAPPWYLTHRLIHITRKIKLIKTRLQEIKNRYDIGAIKVAEESSPQVSYQDKRIVSEVDDVIVGFEEATIDILDQLVGGKEQLQIISIFGMPGLGKTTLAKELYNHPMVNYRFDKLSWCVVSQIYERKRLLIDILTGLARELEKSSISKMEEESLVEGIYKGLKGRRYLIAIDDIWSSNAWNDLRMCFPDDGNGSRVLFTSRNKDVAPSNSIIYPLTYLKNDQCWELLEKKVFHDNPCPPELIGIGKDIAANCRGLPLAVVVIAGILSTMNREEGTWKNMRGRLASDIISNNHKNSMMQILGLSYKHLPEYIKPCFLYLGAFPEDSEIPTGKLLRLWIAEGFIHKEGVESLESVAEGYLMELIDRSLLMVAKRRSDGGIRACVVHDLLRDLCLKRCEEGNFLKSVDNRSIYEKCHCLSSPYLRSPFGQHVRSLHGKLMASEFYVSNMKLLRVLHFKHVPSFPVSLIGTEYLIQLKYLVLDRLTAEITNLVNLEYLVVKNSLPVTMIPYGILEMVKLRCIQVTRRASFDKDCESSQNLEFLSNFFIRSQVDNKVLQCSSKLRKLKGMTHRSPDLSNLTQLESLNMRFYGSGIARIILPSNIRKLTLYRFHWPWEKMSVIGGLPNLRVLKLMTAAFVGETWGTRDGEFNQLKFLKLHRLNLAEWNVASNEHFPNLQRLVLCDCSNLQEIPGEIGEIVTLLSIEVESCSKGVEESAIQIKEEQRDMGNEELRVFIKNTREDA